MDFDYRVLIRHAPDLLDGLLITLMAIGMAWAIAIAVGLVACMAALGAHPLPRAIARVYVNVFRVVPEIVLIFWIYYCFPLLFGLRLSALASGVLALSLTSGAFLAEIFRAGILTVSRGQIEAAHSLGLGWAPLWIKIILPQAARRMMPAFVNTFTELLKHTTLLAGISVAELAYQAYTLGARTFRQLEFLSVLAGLYFMVIFPLSMIARQAEARARQRTNN